MRDMPLGAANPFASFACFAALAAGKSTRAVAGARFWRVLILLDESVAEVRRGASGVIVADTKVVAATALWRDGARNNPYAQGT